MSADSKRIKVTRHGQITIPKAFRERFGIVEGSEVRVEAGEDVILLRPIPRLEDLAGSLSKWGPVEAVKEDLDRSREAGD